MKAGSLLCVALLAVGCSDEGAATPSSPTPSGGSGSGELSISGDPASAQGATWSYRGTLQGTVVDLQGVLRKPTGSGPFPAVIISHGAGGNAQGYSRAVAAEMVSWGLVGIATNYTHAAGVPAGAPGTANEPGASPANVFRAQVAYEILRSLGYVDMGRVTAHGHSMGAFVTVGLVAAQPADIRAASHTAGGVVPATVLGAAPTEAIARSIRTPYQLHHGDLDVVVLLALDQRLANVLSSAMVAHELVVYAGAGHNDVALSATMFARVRAWYAAHGVI